MRIFYKIIKILINQLLIENVLEVKKDEESDRLTALKLQVKALILNIVSPYAPQVGNSMEEKNDFWKNLDGLMESVSKQERIVLGANLNGHVGEGNIGDEELMGKFGAGTRNEEGVDFAKRVDLTAVNIYFKTRHEHSVTYKNNKKVPK